MKKHFKYFLFLIIGMIFINVDNVSAKELNDYMYDAVKNNTWETTSNNKDYYTIKVLIGNTSDSGFNDAYNKNLVKKFFGGKKVSDKVDFILGVCDINNCTYDTIDTLYLIKFDLQMADSNGNVYLIAKNARVSTYQNLKNNKIGYYVSHDISGEKKDQISLNFDNKSDNNSDSNSENKNTKGSADNPFIINGSGTINVYNKDNEYWKSSDKIYFKVNMPNNVVYKSSGRFTIKVDGKSMGENEWLSIYMLGNVEKNVLNDSKSTDYFQFLSNKTYYFYGEETYGKNIEITFKDSEKLNTRDKTMYNEAVSMYGEENVNKPGKTSGTRTQTTTSGDIGEKTSGCGIFGENTLSLIKRMYKFTQFIIPVIVIIFGMLDFIKALGSGEEKEFKKAGSNFAKRVIIGVCFFLIPAIISLFIRISGITSQYDINDGVKSIFCILE